MQLVVALDSGEPVGIDASQVEMLGQAVLQILIAARAEASSAGTEFYFETPSDAFVARATACRAESLIGLDRNKDDQP